MREAIALAIAITTRGDPKPNVYRIASQLNGMGYMIFASEIRESLGMPGDEVAPEVSASIGGLLAPARKGGRPHE